MTTEVLDMPETGERLIVPSEDGSTITWCVVWTGTCEGQSYLVLQLDQETGDDRSFYICHWRNGDGMYVLPETNSHFAAVMRTFSTERQALADQTIERLEAGESFRSFGVSALHLMITWTDESPPAYVRILMVVENVGPFLKDYVILMPVDAFDNSLTDQGDSVVFECSWDDDALEIGEVVTERELELHIVQLATSAVLPEAIDDEC